MHTQILKNNIRLSYKKTNSVICYIEFKTINQINIFLTKAANMEIAESSKSVKYSTFSFKSYVNDEDLADNITAVPSKCSPQEQQFNNLQSSAVKDRHADLQS